MKNLLLIALLCCMSGNVRAEKKTGILYMTTPAYYEVKNISRNGQWACGVKYDEEKEANFGFRWNLQTNYIEMLGGQCQANCISNDGTVAGSFYTSEGISSGNAIEVPAIWKDGEWTVLELPNEKGSWTAGITPDGTKVVGDDNGYTAYVWTNGQISSRIAPVSGGCNMPYVISPDGSLIGGWSYARGDNSRNAGYWTVSDGQFHDLEPDLEGNPWQAVKRFSSDNNKVLYWGDYHEDAEGRYGIHAIYNIETGETTSIYPVEDDPFNFDFYDMNGDGTLVTGYEENGDGEQYGIVWNNNSTELVYDYLTNRGASFEGMDIMEGYVQPQCLIGVPGVDDAANTFAVFYYDNNYYYHTMIVAFDRDMSMTPPVNLKTVQVAGLPTVELSWEAPLGDKSTLKGFNIYRDGELVNTMDADVYSYYDRNLVGTTFRYKVTALYEEGETETGTESTVTFAEAKIQSPTSLLARQKGYNSLIAQWDSPESNLPSLNYYGKGNTALDGFGGGSVSFESGTLFAAEKLSLYDGYSVAGVTFYPASEQEAWKVTLYTHENGNLKVLYSQEIDQELKYGEKNTVRFPEAWKLQSGQDLLVGIETIVNNASYDVQKAFEDCTKEGYTDLVRMVGESNFYSINSSSEEEWNITWATGLLMQSPSITADIDEVDHYAVYLNNEKVMETQEPCYGASGIAHGDYTLGVEAVYSDGRTSELVSSSVEVNASDNHLEKVTPNVTYSTEDKTVKAEWTAPQDNDPTTLQYCGEKVASVCPMTNENVDAFVARVDFLPTELKSYKNYLVKSFSFYPLSSSQFYLEVYEENDKVAAVDIPYYTLDKWNTIQLPEPVYIDPQHTYSFHLFASECPVDEAPLAIDTEGMIDNASYLSVDEGETWSSIEDESYLDGNWMFKMNIAEEEASPLSVNQYDVYLDGEKMGTTTSLSWEKQLSSAALEGDTHTLRVDAHYDISGTTVKGNEVIFAASDPAGIDDVRTTNSQLSTLNYYNLAGQRVRRDTKGIIIKGGYKYLQ